MTDDQQEPRDTGSEVPAGAGPPPDDGQSGRFPDGRPDDGRPGVRRVDPPTEVGDDRDRPGGGPGEAGPREGSFGQQLAERLAGPPFTGDAAVDAALSEAAAAAGQDPAEQLEVYVGTHRALQDRLTDSGA